MTFSPFYSRQRVGSGMYKNHSDIITDTLDYYRNRIDEVRVDSPKPYSVIKQRIQKTIDEGKRVLIDIKDSYSTQTVVVRFDSAHDRWAKGSSVAYTEEGEILVPYTIHYSDILCKTAKIKVIVEGENPFAGH
jgi:hypothetical protein